MKGLSDEAANMLFRYKAGLTASAGVGFRCWRELDAVVKACAQLPLALKVMGAALNGVNSPARWQVRT
jgi:hypothetical protein